MIWKLQWLQRHSNDYFRRACMVILFRCGLVNFRRRSIVEMDSHASTRLSSPVTANEAKFEIIYSRGGMGLDSLSRWTWRVARQVKFSIWKSDSFQLLNENNAKKTFQSTLSRKEAILYYIFLLASISMGDIKESIICCLPSHGELARHQMPEELNPTHWTLGRILPSGGDASTMLYQWPSHRRIPRLPQLHPRQRCTEVEDSKETHYETGCVWSAVH